MKKDIEKEKQITQQSRSAIMGDMMAAIIHQWKQPLNGISIANDGIELLIEMDDFDKEAMLVHTKSIAYQIKNMNKTMNDFRNFFKFKPESCYKISTCIEEVSRLLGIIFNTNNVKLKIDIKDDISTKGYSNELNQVIINILNNAKDAIEETDCEIRDIFIKVFTKNKNAIITITDCAGGIPDGIIDKIFDPYFSTKTEDKGTGIGLDIAKTIIEKVHGTISVQNEITNIKDKEYKGACFTIKLNIC